MNKQQRNTLLLAAGLLIFLAVIYLIQSGALSGKETSSSAAGSETTELYAVIEINGYPYATLPLSEDQELMLDDSAGNYNLVKIEDGAVYVADANCGDLTCVHTGRISLPGSLIACLPHGIVIAVVEQDGE